MIFLWIFIIHKKRLTLFKHFLNHSKSFWIILNPQTVNILNANTLIAFCTLNTSNTSHTNPHPSPTWTSFLLHSSFPTVPYSTIFRYLLHCLQLPSPLFSVPYSPIFSSLLPYFQFPIPLSSASYSTIFSFLLPYLQLPTPLSSVPYSPIFSTLLPYFQFPTPLFSALYSPIFCSLLP